MPRDNKGDLHDKTFGQSHVPGEQDARYIRYKRANSSDESVRAILDDTIHAGVLDAITISDDGGLNVSWTAGEVYTAPNGSIGVIQETAAGNDVCTDDAINYLVAPDGGTLVLRTTPADPMTEVCIGHVQCQNGDIWEVHEEPTHVLTVPGMQSGLGALFPVIVGSGCVVTPDGGGAPFECSVSAGTYWHDAHDPHAVAQYDTRTANTLVRCFIDGAGPETWDFTAGESAIFDILGGGPAYDTKYNTGAALVATNVGKYYRGLFLISEDNVFWIYGQEQFNTLAGALEADNPSIPQGIKLFPKSMAYIYKHGDADFVASTDPRWEDERPKAGIAGGGVTVGDLSTYVQGDAGGSLDNYLAIMSGVGGHLIKNGAIPSVLFGSGLAANQALSFVGTNIGTILWFNAASSFLIAHPVAVGGLLTGNAGLGIVGEATVSTSLTTPLVIGGTAQAAVLTLQASSHGSANQDETKFPIEGSTFLSLKDHSASTRVMMLVGSGTLPANAGDAMCTFTRQAYWCSLRMLTQSSGAAGHHSTFSFCRARGTSAVPEHVEDDDLIASIVARAYSNSAYNSRARILFEIDGAVTDTSTVPMRMVFQTGITGLVESFQIKSDQNILVSDGVQLQFRDTSQYIRSTGANTLLYASGTTHKWNIGASLQMTLTTDTLTFEAGATDVSLNWSVNGHLYLLSGANTRISIGTLGVGFFSVTDVAQQTVAGARDVPEEALANLLTALANYGLIVDNTTAS